ncbi:MAG TPA: BlaI/MecI/CopY family transcriptional regulator [Bacteroidales bacterium]|nr:BlaI/MecI/CopY family transcriptional regulator [Bacteroidales bacterium]HPI69213.1 BlaI/MecI/CopY family transcriptional regulator [Bacteroidales bacterium]HPR73664.1 BlaI/MecI/CopY family transcriptional regulator [Bacteroidales bacterium]
MIEITKAQEEVLKVIWEIKNGAVTDILNNLPDPKPAYNTVATVIKVLERKAYVSHRTYGKTHVYYPLVSREEYANHVVKEAFTGLFKGSLQQMVSPFIRNRNISISDLEELRHILESEIDKKRSQP